MTDVTAVRLGRDTIRGPAEHLTTRRLLSFRKEKRAWHTTKSKANFRVPPLLFQVECSYGGNHRRRKGGESPPLAVASDMLKSVPKRVD